MLINTKIMNNEQILKQIRVKMAVMELNQNQLSEKSGVHRTLLSQILNGSNWTKDTMIRVLEALELNDLINLLK